MNEYIFVVISNEYSNIRYTPLSPSKIHSYLLQSNFMSEIAENLMVHIC